MIGAIIFILIIAFGAVLPALAAWSFGRNKSHSTRLLLTLIGGQVLVTPGVALITFSADRATDENPVRTLLVYGGMALVFSIMTFAIREMINVQNNKK